MSKEQKTTIYRVIIAVILAFTARFIVDSKTISFILYILSYLIAACEVLKDELLKILGKNQEKTACSCEACGKAGKNKKFSFDILDEDFLMIVASIGAFCLKEYLEACAVMIFFTIGELFEDYAVDKSRKNIEDLMDIRPDTANIMDEEGMLIKVDPKLLKIGSRIFVLPGEKVPIDGILISDQGKFDTAALTGESKARFIDKNGEVLSGFINIAGSNKDILEAKETMRKMEITGQDSFSIIPGTIEIEITKDFGESTASKILELVSDAENRKSRSEAFITKFAKVYTPAVCSLALVIFLIPGLITGDWSKWIYSALTFLVISCPCALVISIPLSFFGGIGGASRNGILIKGSNYIETLSKVKTVAFDKTGTLTVGNIEIEDELKPTTKEAILNLKKVGVGYTIMLTGDKKEIAENIGKEAGVSAVLSELLPGDKVSSIEKLLSEKKPNEMLAYVGDGINDAPVLMRADVGISMGAMGTDAAVEASDVVLMDDDPRKVALSIRIAKKCMLIVRENIIFALGVKGICLILGALGIANMWLAIFADVGVLIIAVLNAIRALNVNTKF